METFVVRVYPGRDFAASADEVDRVLRGVVSHIATGRSISFHTAEALVGFLVDPLRGEGIDEGATAAS